MDIVLNEHEWAEEHIESRNIGKKPFETLCRIARYYIDNDFNKLKTRKALDSFLLQCDPTTSLTKWADTLDYALNKALKYKAILIKDITVTKSEIETIDRLDSKQIKRLAFTLLCLSKYWDLVSPDNDHWVNNKDNEIMSMANINTSLKRQGSMYWQLRELGLIQFSKKVDNTNVRVLFAQNDNVATKITDFRNLGYQYLKLKGEPYFECENCGITVKIKEPGKGRKQKYCKNCAVEIRTRQNVNSVMRHRAGKC